MVGTVVITLDRVDPTLLTVLRALLEYLDPAGLGALASDADDAALLAVFAGATMRAAPDLAPRLRAEVAGDPRATSLVDRLEDIGSEMPRRDALTLTALRGPHDPEGSRRSSAWSTWCATRPPPSCSPPSAAADPPLGPGRPRGRGPVCSAARRPQLYISSISFA